MKGHSEYREYIKATSGRWSRWHLNPGCGEFETFESTRFRHSWLEGQVLFLRVSSTCCGDVADVTWQKIPEESETWSVTNQRKFRRDTSELRKVAKRVRACA